MWRRFAPRTHLASPSSRHALARLLPVILLLALLALAACDAPAGGGDSTASHQPSPTATSPTATSASAATAAPHSAVRYVAIGASDAVGVGASNPNISAYVPILISRLPKGSYALNLGIDGETLSRALNDEAPQAIAARPTLITVWLVGNDFKGCVPLQQYGADLNTLLTKLQQQTTANVFVANAPDFSALPAVQAQAASGSFCGAPATPASIRSQAAQWNQVIDATVAAHHDTLVDLFDSDLVAHPDFVSSDGFHPSDRGYLALANLFWVAISTQGAA